MAEFRSIIHIFNQYCSSITNSGSPCHQCKFHYLKNPDHAGCINFLIHYPAEAEQFLLDWKKPGEVCTMCGKPLNDMDKQENFGFNYHVGYGSKHDLEHIKARFCCHCFDKILDHIIDNSIHSPVIGEYAPCGEQEISQDVIRDICPQSEEKG